MNLADLFIAKKLAGGGGGGTGTDNYNDLSNKPQINSTALTGNKSASDLGLQSEIDGDNKISADYVDDTNTSNKFVSAADKLAWSGKQDAIDADHKLDADYVDDTTSTNKFVTASDKAAWDAKQNAIDSSHKLSSDLVDDTGHTNLFVTSTEKSTWSGKQDKIDSSHKLSSTLVSFDSAEAAALASGIDSAKVSQISTNQTNILYTLGKVGRNLLDWTNLEYLKSVNTQGTWNNNVYTRFGVTFTINTDGTITVNGTNTEASTNAFLNYGEINASDFTYVGDVISGSVSGGKADISIRYGAPYYGKLAESVSGSSATIPQPEHSPILIYIIVGGGQTADNEVLKPMICTQEDWNVSHEFTPYQGKSNSDLTYLESEDRAALAEEIDAGAKNMLNFDLTSLKALNTSGTWSGNSYTKNGVTFTYNDSTKTISTYGTSNINTTILYLMNFTPTSGKSFTISGCPSGGSATGYRFCNMGQTWVNDYGSSDTAVGDGTSKEIAIYINNSGTAVGTSSNPLTWKPMICTKAAFDVSPKFVPYRPDYDTVATRSGSISKTQAIGTDWTLIDLTFTGTAAYVYTLSAVVNASGNFPTGIAISTSNNASDFLSDRNLICKNDESPRTTRMMSCSALDIPYATTVYYVWAKSLTTSTNYVALKYQRENR